MPSDIFWAGFAFGLLFGGVIGFGIGILVAAAASVANDEAKEREGR